MDERRFSESIVDVSRAGSRREMLVGVLRLAAVGSILAACGGDKSEPKPPDPKPTTTPFPQDCAVASTCAEKQYCGTDGAAKDCICVKSAEGTNRCGTRPMCSAHECSVSTDCAYLGLGFFCDTPMSGCCDVAPTFARSRCVAPCSVPLTPELTCADCGDCFEIRADFVTGEAVGSQSPCQGTCPGRELCMVMPSSATQSRLTPLLSSLAAMGFKANNEPLVSVAVLDVAASDRVAITVAEHSFVHAVDSSRKASLLLYRLTGQIPEVMVITTLSENLEFMLRTVDPGVIERTSATEGANALQGSAGGPEMSVREVAAAMPSGVEETCVTVCKIAVQTASFAGCAAAAAALSAKRGPKVGWAFGVACQAAASTADEVGCDLFCVQKPANPLYCPCPGLEGCFPNASSCANICRGGFSCSHLTSCTEVPGKCGVK